MKSAAITSTVVIALRQHRPNAEVARFSQMTSLGSGACSHLTG